MGRRLAKVAAGVFVGWLAVLFVLGFALGNRQERRTIERLAESQQARITIETSDLSLIRGRWTMDKLSARRDDVIGKLWLDVAGVRCELAPLGWALFDRDCSELAVTGVRMEVSSTAIFKVKRPKRKPIFADRVVIDDAQLVFMATAIAPTLGRIEIAIDRAESGPTLLRTPLSWLFTLRALTARLALPANITLHLTYQRGTLTVAGALFGSAPIELPLQLPVVTTARDAHEEMQQLVQLGKDVAQRVVAQRAEDWLKSKLVP
jgi:hypothetical protein